MTVQPEFARAGSQRWLQVAVNRVPASLDEAFRVAGAIEPDETLAWCSPLALTRFIEYRDEHALEMMGISELPIMRLEEFWPRCGPVWDGLAVTNKGRFVLVEAKAHIAELLSPPSRAGEASRIKIQAALEQARKFYAPRSSRVWSEHFYQYCNRLAFQYFFAAVNQLPTRLIFVDFCNAKEMGGPTSPEEWKGATRLIHTFLGLPESLEQYGVFHAYLDVHHLDTV